MSPTPGPPSLTVQSGSATIPPIPQSGPIPGPMLTVVIVITQNGSTSTMTLNIECVNNSTRDHTNVDGSFSHLQLFHIMSDTATVAQEWQLLQAIMNNPQSFYNQLYAANATFGNPLMLFQDLGGSGTVEAWSNVGTTLTNAYQHFVNQNGAGNSISPCYSMLISQDPNSTSSPPALLDAAMCTVNHP